MSLQDKWTPLHFASVNGHAAAVDLLIQYGALINQTNSVSLHIWRFI